MNNCRFIDTIFLFQVFDTRLPYPGAHRFKFLGVRIVKIIEHVHCDAQCKTKEHECHKFQKYVYTYLLSSSDVNRYFDLQLFLLQLLIVTLPFSCLLLFCPSSVVNCYFVLQLFIVVLSFFRC